MNLLLIVLCATGLLVPAVLALALVGSPLLSVSTTVVALLIEILFVMMWMDNRSDQKALDRRLRLVARPLSKDTGADDAGEAEVEISVFRQRRAKSWLLDPLEQRFSMVDVRKALPKVIALGGLGAVVAGLAAMFAGFGLLAALAVPVGGLGAGYGILSMQDSGQRTAFNSLFPDVVDHIVRLIRSGLPSVEAISVAAEESQPPVNGVMREISEGISAGLDPETVIRATAARVRIPEFSLFAAAVCLQRATGGGISEALGNLSATLRSRLQAAAKAHSSTAQTRLTLLILALVPVAVLVGQNFTSPESVAILFTTDSGHSLLRYGVGLIVCGILVARSLSARIGR